MSPVIICETEAIPFCSCDALWRLCLMVSISCFLTCLFPWLFSKQLHHISTALVLCWCVLPKIPLTKSQDFWSPRWIKCHSTVCDEKYLYLHQYFYLMQVSLDILQVGLYQRVRQPLELTMQNKENILTSTVSHLFKWQKDGWNKDVRRITAFLNFFSRSSSCPLVFASQT